MQLEELLANLAGYSRDGIVITTAEWNDDTVPSIVYVNPAFCSLTGYIAEEVLGKPVTLQHGPETDAPTVRKLRQAFAQREAMVAELIHYTKRKHKYWVETSLSPVFNAAGDCVYYLGIEKDITDRKVMQQATEQQSMEFLFSETRSRAILSSIADGIFTVNAEGIIQSISPVARKMLAIAADTTVEGQTIGQYFDPTGQQEIHTLIAANMAQKHATPRMITQEFIARRTDGSEFDACITCALVPMAQTPQMVVALRDITHQKRALEEMRAARDVAEAASRAKSEFLANMSHELRTPMNGILGLSEILRESPLDEDQRECLYALSGSATSLLTILNDILDFSKIEAGELTVESYPYHVPEMLRAIRELMTPLAVKRGLTLTFEMSADCPPYLRGDSHRVQQILINLVGNAIKFTEQGSVTVHTYTLTRDDGSLDLHLSVSDTGIGIAPEYQELIFQKFTQADGSNTRKYGGTGLGLAITRQLATLMGGSLTLTSEVGKGSTFHCSIPTERTEAPLTRHESREDVPMNHAATARLLLVEDHPINQMLLIRILKKMGFTDFDRAEDGDQAVQLCKEKQYDLILMDCQMPVMDGYEATRRIRGREVGREQHVPILAMTANAMVGDREKCLHAGMDDYISKPIDAQQLRRAISRWLTVEETRTEPTNGGKQQAAAACLDLAHLRMFTDGDSAEEAQLFQIFFTNAESAMQKLKTSLTHQATNEWQKAAHLLKGASGNLGAKILYQLCADAEFWREHEDTETKHHQLRAIREALDTLKAYCDQLGAAAA